MFKLSRTILCYGPIEMNESYAGPLPFLSGKLVILKTPYKVFSKSGKLQGLTHLFYGSILLSVAGLSIKPRLYVYKSKVVGMHYITLLVFLLEKTNFRSANPNFHTEVQFDFWLQRIILSSHKVFLSHY